MKTLFISPHPDDVEIGAGMCLLNKLYNGITIKSVVVSLGNNKAQYELRLQELDGVRSKYGYDVQLLSMQPANLQSDLIKNLETVVDEFLPDEVFIPYKEDRHQEHEIVSRAAAIAARRVNNKYFYETPSSENFAANHYFIGNEKLLEEKIRLISLFFTQKEKPYLDPSEIRALAQSTGRRALQYASSKVYAEGFITRTLSFADVYS